MMTKLLRFRFWIETGMSLVTGIIFVVTMIWPQWIEGIFGVSPDSGDGSLEWLVVSLLLVATIILLFLARYEWRVAKSALRSESSL